MKRPLAVKLGLRFVAGYFAAFLSVEAATAPTWVIDSIESADANPKIHESRQYLYAKTLRYLSDGRVQITVRAVGQVAQRNRSAPVATGFAYSPFGEKITSASAWILGADRKTIHSFPSRAFLDIPPTFDGINWDLRRVLYINHLDEVPDNGFLAWEVTYDSVPPFSEATDSLAIGGISCARRSFEAIPAPDSHLTWWSTSENLRSPVPGSEPGSLKWEQFDKKPYPEPFPTGFQKNVEAVYCYNIPNKSGAHPPSWRDISRLIWKLSDFPSASDDPVATEAHRLIQGQKSRWARVRAVAEFVQTNITYLEITLERDELAGVRPRSPQTVLRNRYGDCKDKAALLIAMLKAIGEPAYPVLAMSGNPTIVVEDHPTAKFNHMIIALPTDSDVPSTWPTGQAGEHTFVFFDPTDRNTPFGVLPAGDEAGVALVGVENGEGLVRLPSPSPATCQLKRTTVATLGDDGTLKGAVSEITTGRMAAAERTSLNQGTAEAFRTRIEERVSGQHPLAAVTNLTSKWEPEVCQFRLDFNITAPKFIRFFSNNLSMFNPKIASGGASLGPWSTQAEGTVFVQSNSVDETLSVTIPRSYSISKMPSNWAAEGASTKVQLSYKIVGSQIEFHEVLEQNAGILGKSDYDKLRTFYSALLEKLRRPILLKDGAEGSLP